MFFHQVGGDERHKPKDQGKEQVRCFDLLHVTGRYDVRASARAPGC
jgi:hypothetical protein